jgi:putative transposase
MLFGIGGSPRAAAASIPREQIRRVLAQGGKLPLAAILRCRIRHFTDGAVLGSSAFVEAQLGVYRRKTGLRARLGPHPLPACTDWGDLTSFRRLRKQAIG